MDANTRDFVESGREAAVENVEQAKQKAAETAEQMKRYASQAKDAAVDYAKQAKDMTQTHIKENPFWAMMLAVGLGVAIGMLLAPTRQD